MTMIQGGAPSRSRRFQMRAKAMSIGDDHWIEDEHGDKVFKVNGKKLRVRDTWTLEDARGNVVATIREKKLSIRDKIKIELAGGQEATVHRTIGIGDRYKVEVEGGDEFKVKGRIGDHEYKIERDGDKVAEISKKWFRLRDTYGVEVSDDRLSILLLCVTVAVDALSDDGID